MLPSDGGEIRFEPTAELARLGLTAESEVRYLSAEQSNSSVVIGNSLVLKLIRKVASGVHPELEMSAYLTQAGFRNISPLLGSVVRRDAKGEDNLLMIAQGYSEQSGRRLGVDAEQPGAGTARRTGGRHVRAGTTLQRAR